ncbi:MAG: DEAD/DEAH box helicase [Anaerolineae bacterium]
MSMDPSDFLQHLRSLPAYHGQLEHVERLPPRRARYARLSRPLPPELEAALKSAGVKRFFRHQAQAIDVVRNGGHVALVTGTASGKTLAYNVPVIEAILLDPQARALYLFPTKALAQDQLRALKALIDGLPGVGSKAGRRLSFGSYDGDTPAPARARIRREAAVILSNPDMLHLGILPNHNLWADFLRNLRFVVLDEAHVYRGVFGSHVAAVMRRLNRLCDLYGSSPSFICCSATIANPAEHIERLTGLRPEVISDDGSPQGPKVFALWNPPFIDRRRTGRRSANAEAALLFAEMARHGIRNITFTKARVVAELVLRYARDALSRTDPQLKSRVASYRAGYLARDRRQVERDLFGGQLIGVTATSALELGVDVGGLDATVSVGFPGTIASLWQQAGRAGRSSRPSLSVLIGLDDPLDQYFMRHPGDLFGRPHERALTNPDNPYILEQHLPCAAYEYPLSSADEARFGPGFVEAMIQLEKRGVLVYRPDQDRWYYAGRDFPAQDVSIRSIGGRPVLLLDETANLRQLEEIDPATAPARAHPGAIYLHQGESYLVTDLDLENGRALLRPAQADYYTQPREISDVRIVRSLQHRVMHSTLAYWGAVRVTRQVIGFRRVRQYSEAILGDEPLDMPATTFETRALWWDVPPEWGRRLSRRGWDFLGGLHALEHAAVGLLPLFAMCDRWDIGGLSTALHPDTGQPQVFIYDGHPGGVGISEQGFGLLEEIWQATLDTIRRCSCQDGCPSCIQSPKCGNNNHPLDKRAALWILESLLPRRTLLRR